MILGLIITAFVFYLVCGTLSFAFRLSWGMFRVLFRIGLWLVAPVLLVLALVFSLLGNAWFWIALIVLICILGSKRTPVRNYM
ncbi:MAG: hypothetical protein IKG51_01420 [Firmicutes bacterium]|nr:hypothetical protein [Bacillota bacterium]